jgi:cytochrome c oxidase cbb3-type subunit 3
MERGKAIFRLIAGAFRAQRARICLVIFCMAAGAGYALAQQAAPADKATSKSRSTRADGRQLFESTCATCHGLDGRGAERGPNIATRPAARRLSDEEILAILRNGRPKSGMPAFGALGTAKLESLRRHLRELQGLDDNRLATGNSRQGRELFVQKGGCVECHAVNGAGGFLGPDLSIYGAVTPFVEMREQIAQHDRLPRAKVVTLTTRDGRRLIGMVRNEDNFSLQLQTLDGNFHFLQRSEMVKPGIEPAQNQAGTPGTNLKSDEVEALVSYLVEVAKKADAGGKLKRRPVHHEEED